MIEVKITRKDNVFRAVTSGHADYNPGNDIVCAAVSAMMFQLKGAVENLLKGGVKKYDTVDGRFDIRYISDSQENGFVASVIFNTVVIGMLQIQATYPGHVTVIPAA
jgi:uncharacterized protein YsxB (DUF464 family)